MKIHYSEHASDYATYTFTWATYCTLDSMDELPRAYELGFLPYSGDCGYHASLFYMARSLRVRLADFKPNKDDRRLDRKVADLGIRIHRKSKADAVASEPTLRECCLEFARAKFGVAIFDEKRLEYVLAREYLDQIAVYKWAVDQSPLGFGFLVSAGTSKHVWFSFYRLTEATKRDVGRYLLLEMLRECKEMGCEYCYVGTTYGCSSRYKDFEGAEFYCGTGWSRDWALLRRLREEDDGIQPRRQVDTFKSGYITIP